MNLIDKNGKIIKIKNIKKVKKYILLLKLIAKKNPTKNAMEKFRSLFVSETFYSLFTEGELSSRKNIHKIFQDKNLSEIEKKQMIKNFSEAFLFIMKKPNFSISNFFTLYNLLSEKAIEEKSKLKDGHMYRDEAVYIGSNNLKHTYEGFNFKKINASLNDLIDFLNNDSIDIYLRAIVGHIYFEIIHPYFDYNGRTGRFLPLWLFANNDMPEKMMYFATAVGNYREQYLAAFKKYIDPRTGEVNIDEMVIRFLKLLILNQYQYIFMKKMEALYQNKINNKFTNLQKDFLFFLMKKNELTNSIGSWIKVNKADKSYLEKEWRNASFSIDTRNMQLAGIINISSDKPRRFQLNHYQLIDYDKL